MRPRLAFTVSVAAACGLHALLLLVPRPAGGAEEKIPTIQISLESMRGAAATAAGPAQAAEAAGSTKLARTGEPAHADTIVGSVPIAEARPAAALPQAIVPATGRPADDSSPPVEPASGRAGANDAEASAAYGVGAGAAAVMGGTGASGAGVAVIDVITPPRARAEILPIYPRSARKAGLEGIVRIAAVIDESGKVASAEVLSSSGNVVLDNAALQEVQRAVFEPARLAGKPVPFRLIIPFRFRLN